MSKYVLAMISVEVQTDQLQALLDAAGQFGRPRLHDIMPKGSEPQAGAEDLQPIRRAPHARRAPTRGLPKPGPGERLEDYIIKVLSKADHPLSKYDLAKRVRAEGYSAGKVRKTLASVGALMSTLTSQGKVQRDDGSGDQGFMYQIA